jgi:DNA-binding CsgD family transcriptional regulator
MPDPSGHEPDGGHLLPPHTRVALPHKDEGYNIIELGGSSFNDFADHAVGLVSDAMRDLGVPVPNVALREIVDNFIHALPCSASIVLGRSGDSIYLSDSGPGISRPDLALEYGYSTANSQQRSYIRGVGLGLPLAREELAKLGGELHLDTSPGNGTFVHLYLAESASALPRRGQGGNLSLSQRQNNILFLLSEGESLGPSRVAEELNLGLSTAYRELVKLQEYGLLNITPTGKRFLSGAGRSYLQSLLSL